MTTYQEPTANSRRTARQSERGELSNPITTVPVVVNRPAGYPQQNYPPQTAPASSYPSSSYPASNYPASNYPASGYPGSSSSTPAPQAPSYPASQYPAQSYPPSGPSGATYPAPTSSAGTYQAPTYSAPTYSNPPYPAQTNPTGGYQPTAYQPSAFGTPARPAPTTPAPGYSSPLTSYQAPGSYQPGQSYQPAQPYQPPQPYQSSQPYQPAPSYQTPQPSAPAAQGSSTPAYPSPASYQQPYQQSQAYSQQQQPPQQSQSYGGSPSAYAPPASAAQPGSYQSSAAYQTPASYQQPQQYQQPSFQPSSYQSQPIQPYLPPYTPPRATGGVPSAPESYALTDPSVEQTLSRREVRAIQEQRDSGVIDLGRGQGSGDVQPEPSFAATTGHWSRQAEIDDAEQPFSAMISREVGRGNVTTATNALILPATALSPNDFAAAINSTGEIIVSGSITLPGSVARIAQDQRRYDHPNVDNLFDAIDHEVISTNSAPIRAIRSVSSQTATHGIIRANKPHGSRMLVVLLVSASIMAVGVAGLLVAGFVFKIF